MIQTEEVTDTRMVKSPVRLCRDALAALEDFNSSLQIVEGGVDLANPFEERGTLLEIGVAVFAK